MRGKLPLNDAVAASGLDPGAAPDWRSVAPSSAKRSFVTPQFSCTRDERDWFLYLTYSAGNRPGTVVRRFAEAYASGSPVPFVADLGEPKSKRRLIRRADRVLYSFTLEIEMSKRAYGRARADGLSLSAIMRRFVVDYVRRERAARPPAPEPGGARPAETEAGEGRSSRMKESRPARNVTSRGPELFPKNAPDQSAKTGLEAPANDGIWKVQPS
jgi:hypothetical protein